MISKYIKTNDLEDFINTGNVKVVKEIINVSQGCVVTYELVTEKVTEEDKEVMLNQLDEELEDSL